jgi:hypothetical protein
MSFHSWRHKQSVWDLVDRCSISLIVFDGKYLQTTVAIPSEHMKYNSIILLTNIMGFNDKSESQLKKSVLFPVIWRWWIVALGLLRWPDSQIVLLGHTFTSDKVYVFASTLKHLFIHHVGKTFKVLFGYIFSFIMNI